MIGITVQPGKTRPLIRAFKAAPALAERQMRRGFQANGEALLAALVAATPKRTGKTASEWTLRVEGGPAGQVIVENPSPIAGMLESGTAPHVIVPRRARVLRFHAGGHPVFTRRVFHPGTRALHFVERTVRDRAERTLRSLAGYLGRVTRSLKV